MVAESFFFCEKTCIERRKVKISSLYFMIYVLVFVIYVRWLAAGLDFFKLCARFQCPAPPPFTNVLLAAALPIIQSSIISNNCLLLSIVYNVNLEIQLN
jgi:hypothetical protein